MTSSDETVREIHEVDVRVTQFVYSQLTTLTGLTRRFHQEAKWEDTTPIYIVAEFQLALGESGDDKVKMRVVHGRDLPPSPPIQQWRDWCQDEQRVEQFATHIHLACIWPSDSLISLLVISPHTFMGECLAPLVWPVDLSLQLTETEFAERWPLAVQLYREQS
jgi:hypothetical protein